VQGDFFMTQWVFLGMRWLFEHVTGQNIALTVVISTIIIRALTVIGDIKSRQSSMKMQAIQPQMEKIRKKYERDPEKMNRETQKLMKENNVSMFGGCLPMLFTMPLFFIFIAAFRQWGNEMVVKLIVALEESPDTAMEMFESFKFLWVNNIWQPDNGMQPVIASAQNFLNETNKIPHLLYFRDNPAAAQLFEELGFFVKDAETGKYVLAELTDAVIARYDAIVKPCVDMYAGYNNGWFIFPVLCGGTTWLSMWITTRNQPESAAANSTKMMNWMMPIMTFVFGLTMNTAFTLYWTISNVVSMITTFVINKSFEKQKAALEGEAK